MEDDFYKWNKEFLKLSECLGIRTYIIGEKSYPTTQEILRDSMVEGDGERYIREVIPWCSKDVSSL